MSIEKINNRAVHDFIMILSLFGKSSNEEISVTSISKELQMSPSKVSRLLTTAENSKALEKNPENGKYRLSVLFFELGLAFVSHSSLRKIVRPHLEQMALEQNLTASLSIRHENKVITLDRIQNLNIDLMSHSIGFDLPIYSTSVGKILLAYLPEEEQDRILRGIEIKKLTSKTVINPHLIKENLATVREEGYALDRYETHEDLNCIAAPIRSSTGDVIAALNLMGGCSPGDEEKISSCIDYIKQKALFISRQFGFSYSGILAM